MKMGNSKKWGCRHRIQRCLYRVRMYDKGLNSDWDGTFWKDKKKVKESLIMEQGELNKLYDELDLLTGVKNERIVI